MARQPFIASMGKPLNANLLESVENHGVDEYFVSEVEKTTLFIDKEDSSNKKTDVDANKTSDTFFPSIKAVYNWVSGLFAKGAASSTDNAIARFDGATGKVVQNSVATIDDAGTIAINGVTTVQPTLINGVAGTISIGSTNTTNTGDSNQNYGTGAGFSRTTGINSIAQGAFAGYSNTTGHNWIAQGVYAGYANTTGSNWIAQGAYAGRANTTGINWIAQGIEAGRYNEAGNNWIAQGFGAGRANTTGSNWIAQGTYAGYDNTTGSNWIAQGSNAGRYTSAGNLTVANNTVHIGSNSKSLNDNADNEIVIGANAVGNGNNTVTLGSTAIVGTYLRNINMIGALYDSTGSVGTNGRGLKNVAGIPVWSGVLSACSVYNTPTPGTQTGVLNLTTKKHDVANEFNTTTNRFTATIAGLYTLNLAALKLAAVETKIYFRKNGVVFGNSASRGVTAVPEIMESTEIVRLSVGDYIDVYIGAGQVITDYETNKLSVTLIS